MTQGSSRTSPTAAAPRPRRATGLDEPAIAEVSRRAFAHYVPLLGRQPMTVTADFGRLIAEDEVWVVDGDDGALAAALVLRREPEDLYIWSLAVTPSLFGKGLGRSLLDFAETRARALDVANMWVIALEQIVSGREWYVRRGFVETGVEHGADRTVVHMRKQLRA